MRRDRSKDRDRSYRLRWRQQAAIRDVVGVDKATSTVNDLNQPGILSETTNVRCAVKTTSYRMLWRCTVLIG
jgi:hypothetical protein